MAKSLKIIRKIYLIRVVSYMEKTSKGRPIHLVCAYAEDIDRVIIITAYQPDPDLWIDFERRRQ